MKAILTHREQYMKHEFDIAASWCVVVDRGVVQITDIDHIITIVPLTDICMIQIVPDEEEEIIERQSN